MPRKPNYQFERMERERLKAAKAAERADAKRAQRENNAVADNADDTSGEPANERGDS